MTIILKLNNTNLTLTFSATGLTASPAGVTLINSSSAVVPNFNTTTVDYVELSSGYKQAVAGGFANGFRRPQLVATDPASGVALAVGSGRSVAIIKSSPQTVTTVTASIADINAAFECIVLRAPGAWLVGTQYGYIYELNASGFITDQLKIPLQPSTGTSLGISLSAAPVIGNLSYADNLLTVGTDEGVWVYDWSTKTQIKYSPATTGTTVAGCTLSNTASGICLQSYVTPNVAATWKELDIAYRPLFVRDELWGPTNTSTLCLGINTATNVGWAITPNFNLLYAFRVIPRASTLRTLLFVPSPINMFPAASTHTPTTPGLNPPTALNCAAVAAPPSPPDPVVALPATVVIKPVDLSILRIRALPLSAKNMFPVASTAIIYGVFNLEPVAGPPSPAKPPKPLPATVVIIPAGFIFRTR